MNPSTDSPRASGSRVASVLLAPLVWVERARGRKRKLLILSYLGILAFVGFWAWWLTSLSGLPDVGDPFDAAGFIESGRVAEADDSFVLYRKAIATMDLPSAANDSNAMWGDVAGGWEKARPEVQTWVRQIAPSLRLFSEAADRRGGTVEDLATITALETGNEPQDSMNRFFRLGQASLLEASRLQREGDLLGAWLNCRSVLRTAMHLRMRSRFEWRMYAEQLEVQVNDRLVSWSDDPRTDAKLLRQALDEVLALDARTPPVSENYKAQYLAVMHSLGDLPRITRIYDSRTSTSYPYSEFKTWHHALWFVRREPERSRRITRLIFANWLAHCDRPVSERPATVGNDPRYPIWVLFKADPAASEASRAVPPEKLLDRLLWSYPLWHFFPMNSVHVVSAERERTGRGVLIVRLAEALYLREQGRPSPSASALVPRYLKALPEGVK